MTEAAKNGSTAEQDRGRQCERCEGDARVHVLEGYVAGRPVHHQLCSECASTAYEQYLKNGAGHPRSRLGFGDLLIVAGAFFMVLGITADLFDYKGSIGFGWVQQAGLLIGILGIVVGALLRIDLLALGGTILLAGAMLADIYGTLGSPGIGLHQVALILIGIIGILIGLLRRRKGTVPRPITEE